MRSSRPLLRRIEKFVRALTIIIPTVCFAVFVHAVTVGAYWVEDGFTTMVGMAVAAIPEGLPAAITIALALGVQRMAGRSTIIRRLPAVEDVVAARLGV